MIGKCKRLLVQAWGKDENGTMGVARNGDDGCTGEEGNCGCTHAEDRLLSLIPNPVKICITHSPCMSCAKLLVKCGVKEVNYVDEYRKRDGIEYLESHGITVNKVERWGMWLSDEDN